MIRTDPAKINPSLLAPSPRAACYHGVCVYHQIKVRKTYSETDLELIQWSWKLKNDSLASIMTEEELGPGNLLKVVRCTQKKCVIRRSCRKLGLPCTSLHRECHGLPCNNSE